MRLGAGDRVGGRRFRHAFGTQDLMTRDVPLGYKAAVPTGRGKTPSLSVLRQQSTAVKSGNSETPPVAGRGPQLDRGRPAVLG